jgi:acetyl-CoA/propionyl-CoA carboxylase biotin carboxyl carrier protein
VAKWLAEPGTEVAAGTPVLVLEAMKMEITVSAHRAGVLGEQLVATGETVSLNTVLTTIDSVPGS